jgi:tRNA threonylcarbamoyladenosine biosynthesis protein TsaE
MHALGRDVARLSRAGDVVMLIGELGAGKTQLAQGIGEGLHVVGPVISPTFVISRVHRAIGSGPGMIHVDAYRLGDAAEVDDLDLEADMPNNVTVIEWGRGLAEQLSGDRLEIEIRRSFNPEDDTRDVVVTPIGRRWENLVTQWEQLVNDDMGRDARADAEGDGDE